MRQLFIIFSCLLLSVTARAQKWVPGYFYDTRGSKNTGFISPNPSGTGPIKGEAFIEFKDSEKGEPVKLSASDMRSFVIGADSFLVAYPPTDGWAATNLGFVRIAFNGPIKLFASRGGYTGGSGKKKVSVSPSMAAGIGSGGYGSGAGGGVAIAIGDGGGANSNKLNYFWGENASKMQLLTDKNFVDVMAEVMGDEPQVVEKIREKKFGVGNIESLINYFYKVQASHPQGTM